MANQYLLLQKMEKLLNIPILINFTELKIYVKCMIFDRQIIIILMDIFIILIDQVIMRNLGIKLENVTINFIL